MEFVSFAPTPVVSDESQTSCIGSRTIRSKTTLLLQQGPHTLAVLAEAASNNLQQYLANVRYQ